MSNATTTTTTTTTASSSSSSLLSLAIDQCALTIINQHDSPISVWTQVDECERCSPIQRTLVPVSGQQIITLSTAFRNLIQVHSGTHLKKILCHLPYTQYDDQAVYRLQIGSAQKEEEESSQSSQCHLEMIQIGRNNWIPLIVAFITLLLLLFTIRWSQLFVQKRFRFLLGLPVCTVEEQDLNESQFENVRTVVGTAAVGSNGLKKRIVSLDTFRGLVIMTMIFSNYGSGGYEFLGHAPWFGINFADLVFPSFLFIMGTSICLNLRHQVVFNDQMLPVNVIQSILIRSIKLFALGLMVNSINESRLEQLRIPGVLQRLAVCYLIIALLHFTTLYRKKQQPNCQVVSQFYQYQFADLRPYVNEWMFISICVAIYSYFTLFFNYDSNCPPGYQGPGGLHDHQRHFNCTGGAARTIDLWLFGRQHMYQKCTATFIYHNQLNFDPEGALGTLTALLLVFYGLQAGKIMTTFCTTKERVCRWQLWSAGTLSLGLITWAADLFPISKNLFSFSFVNITAGFCFFTLSILYLIIDCKKVWPQGWPFKDAGRNSILLYMGHELLGHVLPFYYHVDPSSHFLLLKRVLIGTLVWLWIAQRLARRGIFWKV